MKIATEELIRELMTLDKYDLENDGACGDPECCGDRYYWIDKIENGEYFKISDVINKIKEVKE